ncbi:MAG: hypothetical protein KDB82_04925 [Planctomycetes bacterium]|nr:hypothetical protein [Planctomycetota bacterium]
MGIPIGQTSTATVEASGTKHEQCIWCNTHYVYEFKRQASGSGTSLMFLDNAGAESRAEDRAYQQLEKAMAKAVEPVRCPNCRRFQPKAISSVKLKRGLSTIFGGLAIAFVAWIATIFIMSDAKWEARMTTSATLAIVLAVLAILLGLGWWVLFNPNEGRNYLKGIKPELADSAMSLEAYEAMLEGEEEAERAYEQEVQQRRQNYEARQAELREKAKGRKQAEMQKMADRAKRNLQ